MIKCVICCGGTGGHLAPGISLAEALQDRGHQATLVVSTKQVDSRLLKSYPHLPHVKTPGRPFGWNPVALVAFFVSHLRGLMFALRYLRRERPEVLIGFGGFSMVGMSLAALLLRIPIVLHEANRCPGKAIRFLGSIATRIYLPPGVRLGSLLPQGVRHYGYPVRKSIKKLPMQQAREALGFDVRGRVLLVFGGSQGATALNQWVRDHFDKLAQDGINVVCVTGLNKGDDSVLERKGPDGQIVRAYFLPFCDRMAELLSSADLVVARAGAGSIAEFMRCRLPAILVPYPHAADDHQLENARFHEKQGGGLLLQEQEIGRLYDEVKTMIVNEWLLGNMRRNLELLDRGNCIELITQDVEVLGREVQAMRGKNQGDQVA